MTRDVADIGLYARSFADVYDAWYANLHDIDQLVHACRQRLEPGARLLELGSGSGRVAAPLAASGFEVIALDSALSMLRQDRSPSRRLAADMARLPLAPNSVDGAVIAYNTLFNLTGPVAQQRCFDELARVLRRSAPVAVEAFIAPVDPDAPFGMSIVGHHTHPDGRLAIATWHDPGDPHLITGAHIELRPDGARSRPWTVTYQSPAELDDSAADHGFELVERLGGWDNAPFDPGGIRHVSWYRLAEPDRA